MNGLMNGPMNGLMNGTIMTVILFVAACIHAAAMADVPPGFTNGSLEQAIKRGKEEGRLVVADFTASWCLPCLRMERETWPDARVSKFLADRAVAVQIDVDADPETAAKFGITGLPVVVVIKDGVEFDRLRSLRRPDEMINWLEGVAGGLRTVEQMRLVRDRHAGSGTAEEVRARNDLARELVRIERPDEAEVEYCWLWTHRDLVRRADPSGGIEVNLAPAMRRLAAASASANRNFSLLRDEAAKLAEVSAEVPAEVSAEVSGPPDAHLADWLMLSLVIGDDASVADWFKNLSDPVPRLGLIRELHRELWDALVSERRWSEALRLRELFAPVLKSAANRLTVPTLEGVALSPKAEPWRSEVRSEVAQLYAVCLAAGRESEGEEIARLMLKRLDDPQSKRALVEAAIEAGVPRAAHRRWLEGQAGAGAIGGALMKRLDEALARTAPAPSPAVGKGEP